MLCLCDRLLRDKNIFGFIEIHILYVNVPNTVRRAEAISWSISDLTVQVYVPSSPSFTLGMVSDSSSFFSLGDKKRGGSVVIH